MSRFETFSWAAVLLGVPLLGCQSVSPVQPLDPIRERQLAPAVVADARSLVEANNRFAFDLYARLRGPSDNLFLSPFSISTAFAMTYAGAAGRTADEMASVFRFPLEQERLHPTYGALVRSLDRGSQLGGYELRVANRTWGQQGFPFVDEFLRITREDYGAEMQQADFVKDFESARRSVNSWVEQQTRDRIRDLFPPGSIDADSRLVLANAIYFKGLWASQFDRDLTRDGTFHLSATERVSVPIMRQNGVGRMASLAGARMLELRYQGKDLSMLIVLPDRVDGLAEVEASLTPEALQQAIEGLRDTPSSLPVAIPRFRIESKFMLGSTLSAMGMPSAFDAHAADFSGIDGRRDLFISAAIHQAFVEVNEEGTEAAAATGVVVGITSVPVAFVADHPFLFLIHDNVTGSILFMGRLMDPRG
jgi:serpin B